MINLISTASKKELRAARRNVILRKYIFTMLALILVITGSYAIGYVLLTTQESTYKEQLAQYEPQKAQYAGTIKKASEYNKNLLVAKSILANELEFSSFAVVIAQTSPQDVVLSDLSIQVKDAAKPIELKFKSKSYEKVLITKEAFENSPYFTDSKIRTISRLNNDPYPHEFTLIVTFDKAEFNSARKEGIL